MLDPLLRPETVAVIGASRSPEKIGYQILSNLKKGGFKGNLVPVNPSADEILGCKAYPSPEAYEGKIDMAVVAVPTKYVMDAVKSSIQAGVKAIIIITAGFKEVGPEGAALEKEIVDVCRAAGVHVLGPNVVGLINTHHKMNASFAHQMPDEGNISVISQSGAICTCLLDWAAGRRLGLSKIVSIGNKADLTEVDFLKLLADDEETKVIVGYLESITCGDDFIRAAEAATSRKPVVILKSGTSSTGRKAASSHTGSLAGADMAYGAAFQRSGVIRADDFDTLIDCATALAMQPLPEGDRVAIITNAGGLGIMAADAVEHLGMKPAALGQGTATALREKLPSAASVGNPIDVLGDADPERYMLAVRAAMDDESVDAVMVCFAPTAMTQPLETARALTSCEECMKSGKPILAVFVGGKDVRPGRDELVAHNLPDYESPARAAVALKAMVDYAAWRTRPPRRVTRFPVNRKHAERVIRRHIRTERLQVGEVDAKEILRAYNFNVPDGHLATTADEAIEIAKRIGFPVAMKIVSPDAIHKSDVGGVRLNLANPEAVRDGFDLMMMRVKQSVPNARIEGAYVEVMLPRMREVILGMTRDPQFGPMLMFGLGGIFVEVMKDVTFHLAPITEDEAMQMLKETKSYALLTGARGQKGVDVSAVAGAIQRISQLATDFPQIAELDINPFMVAEVGEDSIVADARMTLGADCLAEELRV